MGDRRNGVILLVLLYGLLVVEYWNILPIGS